MLVTPRTLLPLLTAAILALAACRRDEVPEGFARATGRLEAEEVHVATKLPGRVAEVLVDEGDDVAEGQVLARMDTRVLDADVAGSRARVKEGHEHMRLAEADLAQRESAASLARKERDRTAKLHAEGVASAARLDEVRTRLETAEAAAAAARARIDDVASEIQVAEAGRQRAEEELDEATLRAPRAGRVQYRLAEPGEVLPAGGRVLTLLDLKDVTLAVFLPTAEAGRVRVGADARVMLDAHPETPLPARVSFVAREAQFTPRQVETRSERQKLSFRVEVRLGDDRGIALNPGTPGVAWIRLDDGATWPDALGPELSAGAGAAAAP